MRKIIALLHEDKEFITKLMEYSKRKKETSYELVVFSRVETLTAYLSETKADLLVCSEFYTPKEEVFSKVTKVLYFTSCLEERKGLETEKIFIYQSAEEILNQIYNCIHMKNYEIGRYEEKLAKVIGVYSPYEGFWNSIVSFFIAYTYATSKSTLFLSFDPFFPIRLLTMDEKNYDLSDLIYYTKQGSELFVQKVKKCIRHYENVDVILGCEHYTDLLELREEDLAFAMRQLMTSFNYEVIIIELGAWNEVTTELFNFCNHIYKLRYHNCIFYEKDKEFERQISRGKSKETSITIQEINMPKEEWKEELFRVPTLERTSFGTYIKNCLVEVG